MRKEKAARYRGPRGTKDGVRVAQRSAIDPCEDLEDFLTDERAPRSATGATLQQARRRHRVSKPRHGRLRIVWSLEF
jgi:hypothetical protein